MNILLSALKENKPLSAKEIKKSNGIEERNVWDGLYFWWKRGLLFRYEKPIFENIETFKGRRGLIRNTRSFYLYLLKPKGTEFVFIQG
jgi:hypothetical protein